MGYAYTYTLPSSKWHYRQRQMISELVFWVPRRCRYRLELFWFYCFRSRCRDCCSLQLRVHNFNFIADTDTDKYNFELFPLWIWTNGKLFHKTNLGQEKTNKHKHFWRDGVRDNRNRHWDKPGPVTGTNRDPSWDKPAVLSLITQ